MPCTPPLSLDQFILCVKQYMHSSLQEKLSSALIHVGVGIFHSKQWETSPVVIRMFILSTTVSSTIPLQTNLGKMEMDMLSDVPGQVK